jgi:hypothetical protein
MVYQIKTHWMTGAAQIHATGRYLILQRDDVVVERSG